MSSRLNTFLAISLLIHLLVMGLLYDPEVQKLLKRAAPQAPPPPPAPSLTVLNHVPPPQPKSPPQFVPTLDSQQAAKENPNAPLESERNTALKSRDPAKDMNSPLPSMTGVKNNGLNYQDTPSSPDVRSTPSQPSPPQKASPQTPQPQKPTPPQPEQKPQPPTPQPPAPPNPQAAPNPVKDAPPTPSKQAPPPSPNAVPIFPAPPEVPKPGDKPATTPPTPNPAQATQPTPTPQPDQKPTPPQPEQKPQPPQPQQPPAPQTPPQPAQPPPSTHSFAQQRSAIDGGATPDVGDPSPEAKETESGKYKAKLYKLIGSRWYLTVEQNMTLLQIGEVRVKFFVRANGVIDQISVAGSSGRTDILETISLKAVEKSSGVMEPFSDSMKSQFGEGFWDEITFTIY